MSDAGVAAYRQTVTATTPGASDDQIRSAANDAYARLLANGIVSNGVLTLTQRRHRRLSQPKPPPASATARAMPRCGPTRREQYSFFNANRSRIVAPTSQSASAPARIPPARATAATVTGGSITQRLRSPFRRCRARRRATSPAASASAAAAPASVRRPPIPMSAISRLGAARPDHRDDRLDRRDRELDRWHRLGRPGRGDRGRGRAGRGGRRGRRGRLRRQSRHRDAGRQA